ncbi:hypothetical protein BH18ACT11_BH18ACT11_07660 [soil metagenome]
MGRRARILHEGEPVWGRLEGEEVVLDGGDGSGRLSIWRRWSRPRSSPSI